MFAEEDHRNQDQVVEIHRVEGFQRALVVHVDDRRSLLFRVARLRQRLVGEDQIVLPGADHVLDLVDPVVAGVFLVHQVGQQRLDVLLVEDREARLETQAYMFLADDVEAQVVEGRDGQATSLAATQQRADPLLHLACGLVGEGHGDDVARLDAALLDQVGDLAGDHAGLAGAGAGKHQQRAADVVHGFLLPGIESGHGDIDWKTDAHSSRTGPRRRAGCHCLRDNGKKPRLANASFRVRCADSHRLVRVLERRDAVMGQVGCRQSARVGSRPYGFL